ncbi:hypothetical protein ACFL6N_03070 [Thermodesulfobacteriota bacterium]
MMDYQGHFENCYKMLKAEPLIFLFGGLVVLLLISVSFGVLVGPFLGAYTLMMIVYLRDGKKPAVNDLLAGMKRFLHFFPFFLLMLLIYAGFFMLFIPGVIFMTWWLYVLPLMADQDMPLGIAMRESRKKVRGAGFFMHLGFIILVYFLPVILVKILIVTLPVLNFLFFLLMPMQTGCLASLYLEQFHSIAPQGTVQPATGQNSESSSDTPPEKEQESKEQIRSLPEE